jgi:hypothetical protein
MAVGEPTTDHAQPHPPWPQGCGGRESLRPTLRPLAPPTAARPLRRPTGRAQSPGPATAAAAAPRWRPAQCYVLQEGQGGGSRGWQRGGVHQQLRSKSPTRKAEPCASAHLCRLVRDHEGTALWQLLLVRASGPTAPAQPGEAADLFAACWRLSGSAEVQKMDTWRRSDTPREPGRRPAQQPRSTRESWRHFF